RREVGPRRRHGHGGPDPPGGQPRVLLPLRAALRGAVDVRLVCVRRSRPAAPGRPCRAVGRGGESAVITVLAAGRGAGHLRELTAGTGSGSGSGIGSPSVEIMTAEEDEEVLDKLARNRRIDAVLLMPGEGAAALAAAVRRADAAGTAGEGAAALAAAIREEDPAGPPVYGWGEAAPIEGVRGLAARDATAAMEKL